MDENDWRVITGGSVTLTNNVVLDIKEHNCMYCGQEIKSGTVFIIFHQALLFGWQESVEKTARLSHGACLIREASWHSNKMLAALELGKMVENCELPVQIRLKEVDAKEPAPCGPKRGKVDIMDGIEVADDTRQD